MLFYCSGHVISLEVCPSVENYTDDVSDQCRDIIKRLQYVNPTINEVHRDGAIYSMSFIITYHVKGSEVKVAG